MNYCESCKHSGNCKHEWRYSKLVYGCEKHEKVVTNEEWIKSLNTEQLAGFIADICYGLQDDIWANSEDTSCDYHQTDEAYWVEWLKEIHH